MKQLFRRLPLPLKLILIGTIPFLYINILSFQLYRDKKQKISFVNSYRQHINQTELLFDLMGQLQTELRFSYAQAVKKACKGELKQQWIATDKTLSQLQQVVDGTLSHFTRYTFLEDLSGVRSRLLKDSISPDEVTTYYINVIYRLNSITNITTVNSLYLHPINQELTDQRIISQIGIFLGIIRSNVFNSLYTRQNAAGTLYGLKGVYTIYNSYLRELSYVGSPALRQSYQRIRQKEDFQDITRFLDTAFSRYKFSKVYTAESWWLSSSQAMEEIKLLQQGIRTNIENHLNQIVKKEIHSRNQTLLLLIVLQMLLWLGVFYSIYTISGMLRQLKFSAQKLAIGATLSEMPSFPNDVIGSLARSIARIDENNRTLAVAATEVGKGNFDYPVHPRSADDLLGNAIVNMKKALQKLACQEKVNQQQVTQAVLYAQEQERRKLGEELHDNINQLLTSVKLYLEMIQTHRDLNEELVSKSLRILCLAMEEIRKLSKKLTIPSLKEMDLQQSIRTLIEDYQESTDIQYRIAIDDLSQEYLSEEMKTALYRIIQEQLTNIVKYAEACTVRVQLRKFEQRLVLTIADDGKGFDVRQAKTGIGLTNIFNRAQVFNGHMNLETAPGKGCKLLITMSTSGAKNNCNN